MGFTINDLCWLYQQLREWELKSKRKNVVNKLGIARRRYRIAKERYKERRQLPRQ